MGMANGFANETVRDGGDDARHWRRSRGLSPDQRDEAERLRRWETRVVVLITQLCEDDCPGDFGAVLDRSDRVARADGVGRDPGKHAGPAVGTAKNEWWLSRTTRR